MGGSGSAAGGAVAIDAAAIMDETLTDKHYTTPFLAEESINEVSTSREANITTGDSAPLPTSTQHSHLFGGEDGRISGSTEATVINQEEERLDPHCQSLLGQADLDANGLLTPSEYAALVAVLLRGVAPHVTAPEHYTDLPYRLKMNFMHLSCVCSDCCATETGIYTGGSMRDALEVTCEQTEAAIGKELEDGWKGA